MNGDITKSLAEKIQQAETEKRVVAEANSVPLPGALREAFSPEQDIKVGKHTVRPFYEIDFEVLQMCDHPLARMALSGDKFGEKMADLRGRHAWIAAWLLCNDVDKVDEVSAQGKEAVEKAARREFGRLQLGPMVQLSAAVLEQFSRYFSTVIALEQSSDEGDKPKKL